MGAPSLYTIELAEKICEKIATSSKSMKTICAEEGVSNFTVICWLTESHPNFIQEFAQLYARAKDMQADFMAEETLDISDDSSNDTLFTDKGELENKEWIQRSKLRVDTRKWVASKLKPKKYGDKVDVTSAGEKIQSIQVEVIHAAQDTNK